MAEQLRHEGESLLLMRQLKIKFDNIPKHYLIKIKRSSANMLLQYGEKILFCNTIEEVFSD